VHRLPGMSSSRPSALQRSAGDDSRFKWMSSQIEYSLLSIRLAGTRKQQCIKETNMIEQLEGDLKAWKANLPCQYQDIDQPHPCNIASDNRKLWVFCQYHEAILRLYKSQAGHPLHIEQCLHSASVILQATSVLSPSVVHTYR
jgi:hypothetical protein